MSDVSAIEWTDATWNPVTGCDRVSPGCAHCYALELAPRLRRFAQAKGKGKWANVRDGGKTSGPAFGVTLHPDELGAPLRWRRPRMVFVNSMSDLFHDEVPIHFIRRIFGVMAMCRQHTFQILTKRPERMRDVIGGFGEEVDRVVEIPIVPAWPLPNVWLGVSIENRRFVHRADLLRDTPAAVRFISAEPLLGPLVYDFRPAGGSQHPEHRAFWRDWKGGPAPARLDLTGIDWLIVGGESGKGHRRIDPQWVRDLRDVARASGTAFFLKQWGGRTPKAGGRELDGRTWDEMPLRDRRLDGDVVLPAGVGAVHRVDDGGPGGLDWHATQEDHGATILVNHVGLEVEGVGGSAQDRLGTRAVAVDGDPDQGVGGQAPTLSETQEPRT